MCGLVLKYVGDSLCVASVRLGREMPLASNVQRSKKHSDTGASVRVAMEDPKTMRTCYSGGGYPHGFWADGDTKCPCKV